APSSVSDLSRERSRTGLRSRNASQPRVKRCRTPKRRRDLAPILGACVLECGWSSGTSHHASVGPNQQSHQLPAVIGEMCTSAVAGTYFPGHIGIINRIFFVITELRLRHVFIARFYSQGYTGLCK